MRKPNSTGFTDDQEKAMQAEYNRLRAATNMPDDIIMSAVILRQTSGMVDCIFQALGLKRQEKPGHEYWKANGREDDIAEIASRPLSAEAKRLIDKWGL